jgi:hypothetical protein
MDMRGDINAFQIVFEEYKNRDSHADIGKSREKLSRASQIIDFLLLGGRRDPGFVIHPLRDKKNRAQAEAIKSMIRELDLLAIQASTMRAGEPAASLYHPI